MHGLVVAGPVRLEDVPLLRRDADQDLELVGELLREARHVLAEGPATSEIEGGTDDAAVPAMALEVHGRRQQRCAGAEGEHGRAGGERGPLAEELDLHSPAADVTVAQKPDEVIGA